MIIRSNSTAFMILIFITVLVGTCAMSSAQTNCESGNGLLSSEWPDKLPPEQIVEKFAEKESTSEKERKNYTFTQDVTIQTLSGLTPNGKPIVDGEFRQTADVSFDSKGARIEHVKFAPQPSLRRIQITPHDLEDIRNFMVFALTTEKVPQYTVRYLGQQRVDELDTYVFQIAPKAIERDKRYFSGKIWVENRDLAIVKTCGKSVPDTAPVKQRRGGTAQDVQPIFVTYREQVDGNWFPTYTRSDDFLFFSTGAVRIREVIKYTDYRRSASANNSGQDSKAYTDDNSKKQ